MPQYINSSFSPYKGAITINAEVAKIDSLRDSTGSLGDPNYYLRTDGSNTFWVPIASGSIGPTGATGVTGSTGASGPPGPTGVMAGTAP